MAEIRFLPALAEAIAEWFPELGGRSLAVSEVAVTKDNVPTLPLVMVAFAKSLAEIRQGRLNFLINDNFIVEFWLEPARYKRADGSETPFWSYYPYEQIREKLLNNILYWEAPGCTQISYLGLTIEADTLAVMLTFTFEAAFQWNAKSTEVGKPFEVGFNLCADESCCPEEITKVDPCL